ncbi:MAG: hypothetical protein E7655_05870 [Ruminococcaceae bacterium]|nr:hypothetical protein [Oscillospiraceae bacterium]
MYLSIGNRYIRDKEVIGIFDLDRATKKTASFLSHAEKMGKTEHLWSDMPRSFLVTDKKIYFTQSTVSRLVERKK